MLVEIHKHRHENSIYFTRDNMICFPKSGHKYATDNPGHAFID